MYRSVYVLVGAVEIQKYGRTYVQKIVIIQHNFAVTASSLFK